MQPQVGCLHRPYNPGAVFNPQMFEDVLFFLAEPHDIAILISFFGPIDYRPDRIDVYFSLGR